jgi:membrane protein DedA with SNARE-associated domain
MEQQVLDFIHEAYDFMGWWGVVALMSVESACIPLPSEIIMPLSGWMLIKEEELGVGYVFVAGLFGSLGCLLGSLVAYYVGAKGGRVLVQRYGKYVLLSPRDLDLASEWFTRYGNKAIFFSRLIPVVRTFISFPAGIARMNLPYFILLTFLGSFPWCLGLALGGYVLGENWEDIREVMRPFDIPILIFIFVLIGYYVYRRTRKVS